MTALGPARWPQLGGRRTLAVPLGATEQHGPHLPLHTDTVIATALCDRLAARLPDIMVAPAVPYGSSGEHAAFPGTLSIGRAALELLLVELVRSADRFAGVVLVSGHGGNLDPLRSAVRRLRAEGRAVLGWLPTGPAGDSHAGHTETSVMLALRPSEVGTPEPGNTRPLQEILPAMRAGGVAAVSGNGVLGDPAHADPLQGKDILDGWADELCAAVTAWRSAVP